jgi:hypothetical protein
VTATEMSARHLELLHQADEAVAAIGNLPDPAELAERFEGVLRPLYDAVQHLTNGEGLEFMIERTEWEGTDVYREAGRRLADWIGDVSERFAWMCAAHVDDREDARRAWSVGRELVEVVTAEHQLRVCLQSVEANRRAARERGL